MNRRKNADKVQDVKITQMLPAIPEAQARTGQTGLGARKGNFVGAAESRATVLVRKIFQSRARQEPLDQIKMAPLKEGKVSIDL